MSRTQDTEKPAELSGKVGRKCTICIHNDVGQIHTAILAGESFRSIASRFEIDKASVSRHTLNCLELDLRGIADAQKAQMRIEVYEEFREQLSFAKRLRVSADEYLMDPVDPLRMDIIPRANEIEITYLDHNDMEQISFGNKVIEKPKKKKAMLDVILASLTDAGLQPEKFSVKRTDILKFALDAIATADLCIDKFARMGGAYQKSRPNEVDPAELIEALTDRLMSKGWEREAAKKFAQSKYGNGQPLQLGP